MPILIERITRLLLALTGVLLFSTPAYAQTVNQYTNGTSVAIPFSGTGCASPTTRTFVVSGGTNNIVDVDIGVHVNHVRRGDLILTLTAPNGDSAELISVTGGGADNLNVLFDDESSGAVSAHNFNDNAAPPWTAPPYQQSFRPRHSVSIFDGDNANGVWTLSICDNISAFNGTFTRADLYITRPPAIYADLSLAKTVSNAAPLVGSNITYTLTASNNAFSNATVNNATVRDQLPAGVTFVSASGTGSYNSGTGIWTIPTLPPGASFSLNITVTVTAAVQTVVTNSAEIAGSPAPDSDSTPNNFSTTEDDDASVSFTASRLAGTPPTLTCPAGSTLLDWNNETWVSGSSTGSATLTGLGTVNFSVATEGTFDAPLELTSDNTGGFGSGQLSLVQNIQYTTRSQVTTTTVTLPSAVPGVQFTVFDVDFAAGDFADKLVVTGSLAGSTVTPALTNGTANYVSGNVAIGDATSTFDSAAGNVTVSFSSPVDTITIVYGNHITAPADPNGQGISLYDFNFCRPQVPLGITKVSAVVSDGVSVSNPKSVPGAIIRYCILISNPSTNTATNIVVSDPVPSTVAILSGSLRSGVDCLNATTVEDDNASGTDETDPVGVSFSGTTFTATTASLAASASFAVAFNAMIN